MSCGSHSDGLYLDFRALVLCQDKNYNFIRDLYHFMVTVNRQESRYYISSLPADSGWYNVIVRNHWYRK